MQSPENFNGVRKHDDMFECYVNGERVAICKSISMWIDTSRKVLLRWGCGDAIKKEFDQHKNRMENANKHCDDVDIKKLREELMKSHIMVDASKYDIDSINKCINNTGFIRELFKEYMEW